MMNCLLMFLLICLLIEIPITCNVMLSHTGRVSGDGKGQYGGKGCNKRLGFVNCSLPVTVAETRVTYWDTPVLPDNTHCYTHIGCFTCIHGFWAPMCQEIPLHRQNRGVRAEKAKHKQDETLSVITSSKYIFPSFIKCKGPEKTIITARGTQSSSVTWELPTFREGNAGIPKLRLLTGEPPGSTFTAGNHVIRYELIDSLGFKANCEFFFLVDVRKCYNLEGVQNGRIECGSHYGFYGETCKIACNDGYQVKGHNQVTCEMDGTFKYDSISCQPIQCPKLTYPTGTTLICSDKNNYRSVCFLSCNIAAGFTVSPRETICQSNKTWLQPRPQCLDKIAPKFLTCPERFVLAYSDKGKTSAVATWGPPRAFDNSETVTVEQIDGVRLGQTFSEGQNTVKYKATDAAGLTDTCTFSVKVITLFCNPPPYIAYAEIKCPNGYKYGSVCTVTCRKGKSVFTGKTTIHCDKYRSIRPKTYWSEVDRNWAGICIQSRVDNCPDPIEPLNGNLQCDSNRVRFCVVNCNAGWDVPRNVRNEIIRCVKSTGKWNVPHVPDCVKVHPATHLKLKATLVYIGECRGTSSAIEIKKKFEMILNDKVLWGQDSCTVKELEVGCGGAKKGDALENPSAARILVFWNWVIPIDIGGTKKTRSVIDTADKVLVTRAERMRKLVVKGSLVHTAPKFTIQLKQHSFSFDESELSCPKGYKEKFSKGSCRPCSTGYMYDKTIDDCTICPSGTYQDQAAQISCKTCPTGLQSFDPGARSRDMCVAVDHCQKGYYSSNGSTPCSKCPFGTYASLRGAKRCLSCKEGTISSDGTSCRPHDVIIHGPSQTSSTRKFGRDTFDYTICLWFSDWSARGSIQIKKSDGTSVMELILNRINKLILNRRNEYVIEKSTSSLVHLCIVYRFHQRRVMVYHNAVLKLDQSAFSILTRSPSYLQLNLDANYEMTIRSLFVIQSALSHNAINELANSCNKQQSGPGITLNDFKLPKDQETMRISIPTKCRVVVDACKTKKRCNGHYCLTQPDGFGFKCICQEGFSGADCSKAPDFCKNHKCKHGVCEAWKKGGTGYTCKCADGFKGSFCEEPIVDGGWSEWLDVGHCSATCEKEGRIQRVRRCDNPRPTHPEGENCKTSYKKYISCKRTCPVCLAKAVKGGIGSRARCHGTSSALNCVAECDKPNEVLVDTGPTTLTCRYGVWNSKKLKVASCSVSAGVMCPPGTYKKNGKCNYCDYGTYKKVSDSGPCTTCPKGKSTEFLGSTVEEECNVSCPPGTFIEQGECKKCYVDTYQDESTQSGCKPCPDGTSTKSTGSTSVEDCIEPPSTGATIKAMTGLVCWMIAASIVIL